jgi:putative pyruvate formate lyase activating enzyme
VRKQGRASGDAGTDEIIRFLSNNISSNTYVNIMGQYRPCHQADRHPALEYKAASESACEAGIKRTDGETI